MKEAQALLALKEKVLALERREAEHAGAVKAARERLKDLGCATPKAAAKKLQQLDAKIDKLQAKQDRGIEQLEADL